MTDDGQTISSLLWTYSFDKEYAGDLSGNRVLAAVNNPAIARKRVYMPIRRSVGEAPIWAARSVVNNAPMGPGAVFNVQNAAVTRPRRWSGVICCRSDIEKMRIEVSAKVKPMVNKMSSGRRGVEP